MSQSEKNLTFIEHLEELRYRIIVSLASLVIATIVSVPLAPKAIGLLTRPLKSATTKQQAPRIILRMAPSTQPNAPHDVQAEVKNFDDEIERLDQVQVDLVLPDGRVRPIGEGSRTGTNFYYRNLTDPISLYFRGALILGLILAIPVWSFQIWRFVAPGLTVSEKRVIRPLLGLSAILFPCGVIFAYFLLTMVINFFLSIQIANLSPLLDYNSYARFAIKLLVGFGIVFELPVAVLLLAHLGVVNSTMLRRYRRLAYVLIAVLAMMVTPPDGLTMLLMMFPLFALYELSVWLTRVSSAKSAEL